MIYSVYDIENSNSRIFKKGHYHFDYIEPDIFEKIQDNGKLSVIGYIKLREIEKETDSDQVIISNGLINHYFRLIPIDKVKHLNKKKLIGYAQVSKDTYIAVYKNSILIPFLVSIALLAIFCFIAL